MNHIPTEEQLIKITSNVLIKTIKSLKKGKFPGLDQYHSDILHEIIRCTN